MGHFGLVCLCLLLLGVAVKAQVVKETFALSGPCTSCGKSRLDSVLHTIPGVKSSAWSPGGTSVTVEFDKAATSLITIQLELSVRGYNAGDFSHTPGMGMSSCCGKAPTINAQANAPVKTPPVKTPPPPTQKAPPPPSGGNDPDEEDEDLLEDEEIFDDEIIEEEEILEDEEELDVDDFPEDEKEDEEDKPN